MKAWKIILGISILFLLIGSAAATDYNLKAPTGIDDISTGIGNYAGNALPADKAAFVKHLQSQGKHVAMVGDGINDSAALATANLSIAMGQGSDTAMNVAMLTIIGSDLRQIGRAIRLSRTTVRIIRENLFWAFFYNIIGVPVAAGLLYPLCGMMLNPMYASMAMAMSSICVVANSLRIRGRGSRQT